ncbi:MAG TPA: tetratricopeptide repeat protein [Planctomycetota bacterium]|nr:tetratricopeptide repeat protein [Planctomycetota bacterium]
MQGELLDPSPEQALAEHLASTPADERARRALADLLIARGQLDMARKVIEAAPDATPFKTLHDTLRARIERAPGVTARPVRFRGSALRVIVLALALMLAVACLVYVPGLLEKAELGVRLDRARAHLADPDPTVRLEAARFILRVSGDADLVARAVEAIDPAKLEEKRALEAIEVLGANADALARGLENGSFAVRLRAAQALHPLFVERVEPLVRAARAERAIALLVMDPIVRCGRPDDLDFILGAARSEDRELRLTTLAAIARTLERPRRSAIFPELQAEIGRVLREDDAEASAIVLQGALAAGTDEALAIALAKLRGRSMLGGRQIELEARRFTGYTRDQLQAAYTNENDANARLVLARALRDKK